MAESVGRLTQGRMKHIADHARFIRRELNGFEIFPRLNHFLRLPNGFHGHNRRSPNGEEVFDGK